MPYIVIRVVDRNTKRPVSGAFVDLNGWTGVTDFTGEVVFNPPRGTYTLIVLHREYSPWRRRISLLRDIRVTVELTPLLRPLGW